MPFWRWFACGAQEPTPKVVYTVPPPSVVAISRSWHSAMVFTICVNNLRMYDANQACVAPVLLLQGHFWVLLPSTTSHRRPHITEKNNN